MTGIPDTLLAPGQKLDGFEVIEVTSMPAVRAVAYRIAHPASGARILHVHAHDEDNLFSVSFPTLPRDHSGAPHILEHAVLSGSQRYPVRDPFFEMVKMSMATFINAMTGWDCTYYPVSSNVKRDLFNLADVYFDAVFHPLLTEETFQREGFHLAPEGDDATGPLSFRGIVFNEMKGVFSDPRSRMYRRMTRRLFPDTVYNWESGGDPLAIPDLTWERLREFHRTYYHPSNAYFVSYGDIEPTEHLDFLRERLSSFERRSVDHAVTSQPRWTTPIRVEETYAVGRDEPLAEKTYLAIHWLTGVAADVEENTLFEILDLVLLGHDASPLRKALVDSKLGHDILYSGTSPVGLENTFCVGLKGSEPERADALEKLAFSELTKIASEPLDPDEIETAFRQAAFQVREISSRYPLMTMERVLESWTYGGDPLSFLQLSDRLDECRRQIQENPRVLNDLIQTRLIDNPHRLTAILRPDPAATAEEEAKFTKRLDELRAKMSVEELHAVATRAAELEEKSGTPNTPEALATLPQLKVTDLPARPKRVPHSIEKVDGIEVIRSDVFANGVSYLSIDFDLDGIDESLWNLIPFFTDAVEKMGTRGRGFEETARRVASSTGGISCSPYFDGRCDESGAALLRMRFGLKALDEQVPEALDVLHDLMFELDCSDRERWRDVISQSRAWVRNHLVHQGSSTAARHAGRGFSLQGALAEEVFGLPQFDLVERIHGDFDDQIGPLIAQVNAIRDFFPRLGRGVVSFTGSDESYKSVVDAVASWSQKMRPEGGLGAYSFAESAGTREGLTGPIQVAHCALAMPAPHFSDPDSHLLTLGARMLSLDYLINEIRFKGNAYGASCSYSGCDQSFSLGSFRDPHIVRTLRVFDQVRDYVQKASWSQIDIDRAIIGTAKHNGQPIRPGSATSIVLSNRLRHFTDAMREERYASMLAATPDGVKQALLRQFDENFAAAAICVVSSEEKLEEANRELEQKLALRRIITEG